MALTPQEYWKRLTSLKMWSRRGERAPHKPLLILMSLGHLVLGHPRLRPFRDIEAELIELLNQFGPPRGRQTAYQPFLRLPNDRLWEVEGLQPELTDRSGQLRPHAARDSSLSGGFPVDVHDLLAAEPSLLRGTVTFLLDEHFPESLHAEILEALNLAMEESEKFLGKPESRLRDPTFRPKVIRAYEFRCAICDYDIQIQNQMMGLEAAHIRWHSHDGPDEVTNGLALCSIHHLAFDRGGIAVSPDLHVLVSPDLQGLSESRDFMFSRHDGQPMRRPRQDRDAPDASHLNWHLKQVFRGKGPSPRV